MDETFIVIAQTQETSKVCQGGGCGPILNSSSFVLIHIDSFMVDHVSQIQYILHAKLSFRYLNK